MLVASQGDSCVHGIHHLYDKDVEGIGCVLCVERCTSLACVVCHHASCTCTGLLCVGVSCNMCCLIELFRIVLSVGSVASATCL